MTFPEAILPVIAIFKTDGIITILNRETLFFLAGMIIFTIRTWKNILFRLALWAYGAGKKILIIQFLKLKIQMKLAIRKIFLIEDKLLYSGNFVKGQHSKKKKNWQITA